MDVGNQIIMPHSEGVVCSHYIWWELEASKFVLPLGNARSPKVTRDHLNIKVEGKAMHYTVLPCSIEHCTSNEGKEVYSTPSPPP